MINKKNVTKEDFKMTDQTETSAQEMPEINMQDLAVMRQIIDASTQAGVFKAADMSLVGSLYDKLSTVVNIFVEQQKANQEAEETTSED